jgi:hypothetical protein
MKKLIYLLGITLLLLQSCSSGDDSSICSSAILCKKQVNGTFVFDYIYNGNKIERSMANGKLNRKYYYTGDMITKIEEYNNNQLRWITTFTYDNGMLATRLFVDLNPDADPNITSGDKTIYSYNSNNTISYDEFDGTATEQSKFSSTGIITLLNGQVVKNEAAYGTTLVTYDNKNSPFKNVTGFDKLMPAFLYGVYQINNPITIKYYDNIINTFYYEYNEQGYPISWYAINSSGSSTNSTQYFY